MSYLSAEWLARLPPPDGDPDGPGGRTTVLTVRHVVHGAPDGDASYDVAIADGVPALHRAGNRPPDVTLSSDYQTAAGIASGRLSAEAALAAGRITVRGDLRVVAVLAGAAGVDPLPPELRAETEMPT